MKRILTATTVLWLAFASTGHAQIPVTDIAAQIGISQQLLQSLKGYALQIQQAATEARQLEQLAMQAASMIQHPSLGAAMGLMGAFGITNSLPINPYVIMSLTSGLGMHNGLNGILNDLSGLGSLVTASGSINHVYTCVDQSFTCQTQMQQANANAGYQGIIAKVYTDLSNHIQITDALRHNLFDSTDPAQRENAIAQLTAEQNWITTTSAELNSATALYQAQQTANINRGREYLSQSIDTAIANMPKQ